MAKSEKTVSDLDEEIAQLQKKRDAAVKALGVRIAETLMKKRGIKSIKGFNEWFKNVEKLEEADAKAKADIKAEVELLTDPSLQSDDGSDETTLIGDSVANASSLEGFGVAENSQR